jgi:hypothetical protein
MNPPCSSQLSDAFYCLIGYLVAHAMTTKYFINPHTFLEKWKIKVTQGNRITFLNLQLRLGIHKHGLFTCRNNILPKLRQSFRQCMPKELHSTRPESSLCFLKIKSMLIVHGHYGGQILIRLSQS